MKNFLIGVLLFFAGAARAADPPHYELPLPQKDHYASAIIVEQCTQAVAVILVDAQGGLHPMHWSDYDSRQALDNAIFNVVPSHTTLEVTLECPGEKTT